MLWGKTCPSHATLVDILYCCPQARLRTFPGGLGNRGDESSEIKMGRQESGVQIALHRPNAAFTLMPALPERLLDVGATAMTVLRQFGGAGGDFMQDAASSCNRAFQ